MRYVSALKQAKPLVLSIEEEINEKLKSYLKDGLYKEILKSINGTIHNANATNDLLEKQILSGNLMYDFKRGGFKLKQYNGSVAEKVYKLGASYLPSEKLYIISYSMLPAELQAFIGSHNQEQRDNAYAVLSTLGLIATIMRGKDVNIQKEFDKVTSVITKIIDTTEKKELTYAQGVKPAETLDIPSVKISDTNDVLHTNDYYKSYIEEVNKNIKGFAQEEIDKIRKEVRRRLQTGDMSNFQEYIQERYGLASSRTKLIARQELRNAMSQYEKARYSELGITTFKWMNPNPNEANARPHHKLWGEMSQKGHLFDSTEPPQDPKTNKPEMPGEPFYCDCYAVYVRPQKR